MSHELVQAFLTLRDDCIWLQTTFNYMNVLFESENSERDSLMRRTAPIFFEDLNRVLIEYFVVNVYRLTDRPQGMGRQNLTISGLNEKLKSDGLMNTVIERSAAGMLEFGQKLKDARHRIVAHSDWDTALNKLVLGVHSDEERKEFFFHMYTYVDAVGEALGVGPLDFRSTGGVGDALDLLRCLKAGQHRSRLG
ncbi:hypothetical protein [Pseudomonas sp. 43(2021)]|uniref:AbiU2 domain-containing protein n=1 Tax=Pseudomonas sp. 43(2021) TaxID=2813560 RepID=UPI001A9F85B7|nr:hypothetical protein [Pseudomonas sp. 43(2021)]